MADGFGSDITNYVIAGFLFIFTFISVIGCYTVSESNVRFIRDNKKTI